jgi:hypothetical protein
MSGKPGDYYTDFVARVLSLLGPDRVVRVGEWIEGPDGLRDMDVEVCGTAEGRPHFCLVECKDWDRPVGIQVVDAFDSKRKDLGADRAIIYSNSGFTAPAVLKAKRVGIELAAAVCEHDPRIKARLVTRHVARAVIVQDWFLRLMVVAPARPPVPFAPSEIFLGGLPLQNWVHERSAAELPADAGRGRIEIEYRFRSAVELSIRDTLVPVAGFRLVLTFESEWVYQDGPVDLSIGAFDAVNHTTLIPPKQSIAFPFKTSDWQALPPGHEIPGPIDPAAKGFQMRWKLFQATPPHELPGVPDIDHLVVERTVLSVENVPWTWAQPDAP